MKITRKFKQILSTALACLLLVGAVGAVAVFATNDSKPAGAVFKVGGLDPETGKYVKTDKSIYTEKAFECIGLRVEPDFESTVKYDVYYYDKDGNLLDTKFNLTEIYDEDFPLAQYARIVIHPEKPEDVSSKDWKISIFDVARYAKMLKITVDKKQEFMYENSINLYTGATVISGKSFKGGTADLTSESLVENDRMNVTTNIAVDGTYDYYDVYVLFRESATDFAIAAVFEADKKLMVGDFYHARNSLNFDKPIWVKMTIDVSSIETFNGQHLGVAIPADSLCYIYGYND